MKRVWILGSLALLPWLASCSGDEVTEILVVVDSDLGVPGEIDRLRVEVTGSTTLTATGDLSGSRGAGLPRTVGVVKEGDGPSGPLTIRAVGVSGGTDVVEASASTYFRSGQTLVLSLFLARTCVGVDCTGGQTCSAGACTSNTVDPADLPEWNGTVPRHDGGTCMPVGERCNGMDDDCDGLVDEDFDLQTDTLHCGGCNVACNRPNAMTSCVSGSCQITGCLEGFDDCNDDLSDGCEDGLDTASHCGACDNTCTFDHAVAECVESSCTFSTCEDLWGNCNATEPDADGCETSLETVTDCNGCGVPCEIDNAIETCAGGTCAVETCEDLWGDCDTEPLDCEQPLTTLEHCGGCETPCTVTGGTPTCDTGTCTAICDAGLGDCDSDPTDCEQPLDTVDHCTDCGRTCTNDHGTASCASGTCEVACDADWGDCDMDPFNGCETDLRRNDLHCGACFNACTAPDTCRPAGGGTFACS